jgi:hypothetical protein
MFEPPSWLTSGEWDFETPSRQPSGLSAVMLEAVLHGVTDGVVVAGCAESACYNRLGVQWTEQRFAAERDPYLRARVPRERIATVWTSALAAGRAEVEISEFAARVAAIPPQRLRSPLAVSSPVPTPKALEAERGPT